MSTPLANRAETLFHQARSRPADQRAAFLDGACGNDAALRSKVEALLQADAEAGSFLASAAHTAGTTVAAPPSEDAGTVIGRYKLLQTIGEGGFGVVWMGEQKKPVKRRVALEIIKLGMDTKQVIAGRRRRSERRSPKTFPCHPRAMARRSRARADRNPRLEHPHLKRSDSHSVESSLLHHSS